MKASLPVAALRNAAALSSPKGTVMHSDRGSQDGRRAYTSSKLGASPLSTTDFRKTINTRYTPCSQRSAPASLVYKPFRQYTYSTEGEHYEKGTSIFRLLLIDTGRCTSVGSSRSPVVCRDTCIQRCVSSRKPEVRLRILTRALSSCSLSLLH